MKNNRLIYILIVILALWLGYISRVVYENRNSNNQNIINQYNVTGFSTDFTRIIDEINPAIVTVNADGNISSGFVYSISSDKVYILSSYHGVSNANTINVTFASSYTEKGEVIGHDPYIDLSVIEISTPYQMNNLKVGDANLLKKGEFVICIGTPISADYASAVEMGMISLKNVTVENTININDERLNYYLNLIQLSGDLLNGYSGSPIINMNGEFVGMLTMNLSSNFNFAISANEIQRVADRIINAQNVVRNNIGIKGEFVAEMYNYEKANLNISIDTISGIFVSKIKEGSLAYNAGVRSGDILLSVNNKAISNFNDYLDVLYSDETTEFVFEYLHNSEVTVSGAKRD